MSKLDQQADEILKLLSHGVAKAAIARVYGSSWQTVHAWVRKRVVVTNRASPAQGFRCTLLSEYIGALQRIDEISRRDCRKIAVKEFSEDAVAESYQMYFERLHAISTSQGTATFL